MPPNGASQDIRQRRPTGRPSRSTIAIGELKGNEIAIEGSVYDLTGFDHPGGSVVKFFGGNDVSVQYRMIHPSHTDDRFLSKMTRVGTLALKDVKDDYTFDTPFERELKSAVRKIVPPGQEFATPGFVVRAVFYVAFLFTCQFFWATSGSTPMLAVLFGLSQALIGLNVQHDANHGAVSKKPFWNELLGFGADLIGGAKYNWMQQHWTHHAYTNHNEMDPDSFSAEPLMLFNDYPAGHPARKWFHSLQGLYFLPLLSFYWLSMIFNPQLIDLQQAGTKDIMNWRNDYIKSCRYSGWAIRVFYLLTNVVSCFIYHPPLTALYHIWIFSTVESLTLSCLFSLSHNFESVDRDPTKSKKEGGEPVCWAKSQVETSSTYGGFIAGYLTGGLNFQVEHHLFPRMSSAWYPHIAPKVREICKKHDVHYAYYPWPHQNFISTVMYMHRAGTGAHWVVNPLSGDN